MQEHQEELDKEKQYIKQELNKLLPQIQNHIGAQHDYQSECSNLLAFLTANIECLIEDLDEWSRNDYQSWILMIKPEGLCEEGKKIPEKIINLLNKTKDWDEKYPLLVDGASKSLSRLQKELDQLEEDHKNPKSQQNKNDEEQKQQMKELLNDRAYQLMESFKLLQNPVSKKTQNNNFLKNSDEGSGKPQNNQIQKTELEQQLFQKQVKEIQEQISLLQIQIEEHIQEAGKNGSNNCQCKNLVKKLAEMSYDIPFWCDLDQKSYSAVFKLIKIKCDQIKPKFDEELKVILQNTNKLLENFPSVTSQENQIMAKFSQENPNILNTDLSNQDNIDELLELNINGQNINIVNELKKLKEDNQKNLCQEEQIKKQQMELEILQQQLQEELKGLNNIDPEEADKILSEYEQSQK
ncbi:hypothetical protein PPERSA_00893 [Pseudocohnilembus persalinus]|uniref:Uncharacterized protein n=1 Tax=Pseudocohnilembus persalinus TaxID=266149 RepID=A0A0V0QEM2_PSEPJ|nr:hypothetical protein PPERSA_00893 [Pseudocohnilembus persalinus]|eukprot:KRX00666.1 hypothetical protein PPERSA_00893 [Pseudocohnilembus persalinus]